MFTGIVQGKGKVVSLEGMRLCIAVPLPLSKELNQGASVAIDGVCLTLVALDEAILSFDMIEETRSKTTLGNVKPGSEVNIERSAKWGDEIGGHLLSGHISATATLSAISENLFPFHCPPPFRKYLFPKGFIALDGMSLTLVDVDKEKGTFTVHLIPETLAVTTIASKSIGTHVNLEIDRQTQTTVDTLERILNQNC